MLIPLNCQGYFYEYICLNFDLNFVDASLDFASATIAKESRFGNFVSVISC